MTLFILLVSKELQLKFFFKCSFIFERERERERTHTHTHTHTQIECKWGEGQREGETQNLKQAPGSELSAQSLMQGSNPQAVRS